jgi:ParB family chromosome partitioning protein
VTRKALGRGLSALIPGTAEPRADGRGAASDYFLCPIERIQHASSQPRRYFDEARLEELAASIREQGIVQPLVVRAGRDGQFVLVAGERRWRAAQRAGVHEVPVVIRNVSEQQAFELALVENLQREDLNPIEEAEAYRRLVEEHGYTQEQLADRLGRDRSTVANGLRLLKLPEAAQQALASGEISAGHARALLGLERPAAIKETLRLVAARGLSVRQTEALVRRLRQAQTERAEREARPRSANVRDLEERLGRALQSRVRVLAKGNDTNRGRIEIAYGSLDELDRILEVLLR